MTQSSRTARRTVAPMACALLLALAGCYSHGGYTVQLNVICPAPADSSPSLAEPTTFFSLLTTTRDEPGGPTLAEVRIGQHELTGDEPAEVDVPWQMLTWSQRKNDPYRDRLGLFMAGYQTAELTPASGDSPTRVEMAPQTPQSLAAAGVSDLGAIAPQVERLLARRRIDRSEQRFLMVLLSQWRRWSAQHAEEADKPAYRAQDALARRIASRLLELGAP